MLLDLTLLLLLCRADRDVSINSSSDREMSTIFNSFWLKGSLRVCCDGSFSLPPPVSVTPLYRGVLPDGTLSDLPVFRAAFGSGETAKTFTRGEHDPAVCVLNAIGAQRVRVDTFEFCTWSEKVQQPEIFYPLSD